MKVEAQRIAIAEACGKMKWSYALPVRCIASSVPDYLNDRNAMQEAVNHLDETQRWNYAAEIVRITGWDRATDSVFALLNVSVEEMAEAFLKTLGLWEEENK